MGVVIDTLGCEPCEGSARVGKGSRSKALPTPPPAPGLGSMMHVIVDTVGQRCKFV